MDRLTYLPLIEVALREDLGSAGDITTAAVIPAGATAVAHVTARVEGRLAGIEVAGDVFRHVSPAVAAESRVSDGSDFAQGDRLMTVSGPAAPILTAERTALNLLGRMCGIATLTRSVVRAVDGTGVAVAETRKTTPGLRALEKYAVRMGGGRNHRFGLDDAVMIKDNHIAVAGSVTAAVAAARAGTGHTTKIEVEVDTLAQLEELLTDPVDIVLLDNMSPEMLREAVDMVGDAMITEASGGITLDKVRSIAETGVDVVSLGWLTHSAQNLDVGLDIEITTPSHS